MRKKLLIYSMAAVMAASSTMSSLAAIDGEAQDNSDVVDKSGSSQVTLTVKNEGGGSDIPGPVEPETFSVSVPTVIPISMDLSGKIEVPSNLKILNGNDSAIKCTGITVTPDIDWALAAFDSAVAKAASADKTVSFAFRGDKMSENGVINITEENWNFGAKGSLSLNAKVKIPKQSAAYSAEIANIEYAFDWSNSDVTSEDSIGSDIDTPSTEEKVTLTFEVPEGVTLKGNYTVEIGVGEKVVLPEVEITNFRYEVKRWYDLDTSTEITADYVATKNTRIKLELQEKSANEANWFTANGNTLTGLSDTYLNLVDAPTNLVIPDNIGGSTITSIGAKAFENKDRLTSIVVPDTVTTIASDAFSGTSSSLKIDVAYAPIYSILESPWGASNSNIIWSSSVDSWNTDPVNSDELSARGLSFSQPGAVYINDSTNLDSIVIPTSVDGVKVTEIIANSKLTSNASIKSISIPDSVTSIGENAFKNIMGLRTINIPNSVSDIGSSAFHNCYGLEKTVIPDSVDTIGENAFYGTTGIVYDGSLSGYPWGASVISKSLTDIVDWDTNPMTSEGVAALKLTYKNYDDVYCILEDERTNGSSGNKLASGELTLPTSIDGVRVVSLGNYAFSQNVQLTKVSIPNSYVSIGSNLFSQCSNITEISLGDSIMDMGKQAIYNMSSLNTLKLPKYMQTIKPNIIQSLPSLVNLEISEYCTSIENFGLKYVGSNSNIVTIPSTVTTIGEYGFQGSYIQYSGPASGSPWGATSVVPNN